MRVTELINLLRDKLVAGHEEVVIKHDLGYYDFELTYDRNGNLIITNLKPTERS